MKIIFQQETTNNTTHEKHPRTLDYPTHTNSKNPTNKDQNNNKHKTTQQKLETNNHQHTIITTIFSGNALNLLKILHSYNNKKSMFVGGVCRDFLIEIFNSKPQLRTEILTNTDIVNDIKTNQILNNNAILTSNMLRQKNDQLTSKDTKKIDYDIATELTTNEIIEVAIKHNIKYIETGTKHGTITLIFNSDVFEVTTLRIDKYENGRHSDVEFLHDINNITAQILNDKKFNLFNQNWEEFAFKNKHRNDIQHLKLFFLDSLRRDFTINAIYIDSFGEVFDFHNGITDLIENKIKFIGNIQQRIQEDYLRIFRYFRFVNKYNSLYDKNYLEFIYLFSTNLNNTTGNTNKYILSGERIVNEITKIIEAKNGINCFLYLQKIFENGFNIIFSTIKLTHLNKALIFFQNYNIDLSSYDILSLIFFGEEFFIDGFKNRAGCNDKKSNQYITHIQARLKFNKEVTKRQKEIDKILFNFAEIFLNTCCSNKIKKNECWNVDKGVNPVDTETNYNCLNNFNVNNKHVIKLVNCSEFNGLSCNDEFLNNIINEIKKSEFLYKLIEFILIYSIDSNVSLLLHCFFIYFYDKMDNCEQICKLIIIILNNKKYEFTLTSGDIVAILSQQENESLDNVSNIINQDAVSKKKNSVNKLNKNQINSLKLYFSMSKQYWASNFAMISKKMCVKFLIYKLSNSKQN